MDNLTVSEYDTLIEALDAWTSASKRDSMLAGLFIGAIVQQGGGDGKEMFDISMKGEKEKETVRKEQATMLKAKLLKFRDAAMVRELAQAE